MSRNLTFSILGLISLVLAYVFYPSLDSVVKLVVTANLPRGFIRLLQQNDLIAFSGFISLFGLSFFVLYLLYPVSYVCYNIIAAKNIIAGLPLISNALKRTEKKTFITRLKKMGVIGDLAKLYEPYLIQGPEEKVKAEALRNVRPSKKKASNNKNKQITISPVTATVSADVIFNNDSLVIDRLLLGFFTIFARIMTGVGVICLGVSVASYSLVQGNSGVTLYSALLPGTISFLYLLVSAVIIAGMTHLVELILSQNVKQLSRMINGLFHQSGWLQNSGLSQGNIDTEQLEGVLLRCLDKPMKEISKAVKALSAEQEKKLDDILSKTLVEFTKDMQKNAGDNAASLNKTLKDTAYTADKMKISFRDANVQFSKQLEKQTTEISKSLIDMQLVLRIGEKNTHQGTEKIISSLSAAVEGNYAKLGDFMESSLNKLEAKQKIFEKAVTDKSSILKDLHSSAKDLGTISNASGMLLERFILLSAELDNVLKNIQENGTGSMGKNTDKRDKLKSAMSKLQKSNKDRISELPDM